MSKRSKFIIILLLAVTDDRFYRKPSKYGIPLRKQQCVPQTANAAIPISKGVNKFKLIVEHTATNQHVNLTGLRPFQKLHDQIRDILWKGPKMQDMTFAIHYAYRSGAEHP